MKRVVIVGALALVLLLAAGCGGSHTCLPEVTLRATSSRGQPITSAGMQVAQQIIESRLNRLGVSSPTVTVKDGDELVIHLAGVHDAFAAAKIIGDTGRFQLFDFERSLAPPTVTAGRQPAPLPSLYALLEGVQKEAGSGTPQAYYLVRTNSSHQLVQGPATTLRQLFLPYRGGKQPPYTQVLTVPANREPVRCRGTANCPGAGSAGASKDGEYWYLFKLPAALTGKELIESDISADTDQGSGRPIVVLSFTSRGGKAFQAITKAEYDRGHAAAGQAGRLTASDPSVINRYAGHNAIVLDGELKSTPFIDYTDPNLSLGIPPGNGAEIAEPTVAAAQRTAFVLQTGSLPYTFKQVAQTGCSH